MKFLIFYIGFIPVYSLQLFVITDGPKAPKTDQSYSRKRFQPNLQVYENFSLLNSDKFYQILYQIFKNDCTELYEQITKSVEKSYQLVGSNFFPTITRSQK